ncbi:hypothetical protein [Haliea sp. E17]|uniref:hypothetical protein n=1 Tax=Haliea sp. E17 TaxID=3401576 RepID=UPI003AAAE910
MQYMLYARDGSIKHHTEAGSDAEAYERLARSLNYESFQAMADDLGYSFNDFMLTRLENETRDHGEQDMSGLWDSQKRSMQGAFKLLRRGGG